MFENYIGRQRRAAGDRRRLRLAATVLGLVLSVGLAGDALAQAKPAKASKVSKDDEKTVEEVVVTATGTNISDVPPVGSEAVVLNQEAIRATGAVSIVDVVRTLPQVQTLGYSDAAIATGYGGNAGSSQSARGSGNNSRGSNINLRGLPGVNATLLLVDGRRVAPSGVFNTFQEANQVPLSAIERVEVIADGASAIYGADAISGVVNYVLRKRYEGFEISGRYGSGKYGGDNIDASFVGGLHWNSVGAFGQGNLIFSYEYSHQDPILRGKLPFLRADLRPFGGNDNRISGGANYAGFGAPQGSALNGNLATAGPSGNIVVPTPGVINSALPIAGQNIYYGLPAGLTGTPTAAQVLAGLNNPNLMDISFLEDVQPKVHRDQFFLHATQELSPSLSVYYTGFATLKDSETRIFYPGNSYQNQLLVRPGTPFYISGLTGATDRPYYVQYNVLAHKPAGTTPFKQTNPDETYSHTVGFDAKDLPRDWSAGGYATFGLTRGCGVCFYSDFWSNDTPQLFEYLVNQGQINPYSSAPLTRSQYDRITGTNLQTNENRYWDLFLKADGALFNLPAGAVKVAVGGEWTRTSNHVQNAANRPCDQFILGTNCTVPDNIFRQDANTNSKRKQYSFFGEVFVPLINEGMDVPLVEELNVNGAVRYDHFDDFGTTTNPKIGVTWKIFSDLSLRGSWGTSFRAPSLQETDPGAFSAATQATLPNNTGNPAIINDVTLPNGSGFASFLILNGGNAQVRPEEGETFSIGADYSPRYVPGLKVSATYFNIEYKGRITMPPAVNYALFGGPANAYLAAFATPTPTPAGCSNANPASWHPLVRSSLQGDLYGPNTIGFLYNASSITNPCGIRAVLDGRYTNTALTKQDGIDVSANYVKDTDFGFFSFNLAFTHILSNETTPFKGLPSNDELDRIFFPISKRGRASVGWLRGPVSVNFAANYVGPFINDQPVTRYTPAGTGLDPVSRVRSWTTFDLNLNYAFGEGAPVGLGGVRASLNLLNLFDREPRTVLTGTAAAATSAHGIFGRTWSVQLAKRF